MPNLCIDNARRNELSILDSMTKFISLMSNVHPSHTTEEKLLYIKINMNIELVTTVFYVGHKQGSISGQEG